MVAETPTGSIQESPVRDDNVLTLTPIAKTDFRLTIEPIVMLLILGTNINCECSLIIYHNIIRFVPKKLCLV